MLREEITIGTVGTGNCAADQARHHLTKSCNVILGLGLIHPLDTEKLEGLAQFHERATVQRAGQILGRVGQELALGQSDEQVEILTGSACFAGSARSLGERRMRHAERSCVTPKGCQAANQLGIRTPGEQSREQRVFARTGTIQFIDHPPVRTASSQPPHRSILVCDRYCGQSATPYRGNAPPCERRFSGAPFSCSAPSSISARSAAIAFDAPGIPSWSGAPISSTISAGAGGSTAIGNSAIAVASSDS